jgi:hypothetical protein
VAREAHPAALRFPSASGEVPRPSITVNVCGERGGVWSRELSRGRASGQALSGWLAGSGRKAAPAW